MKALFPFLLAALVAAPAQAQSVCLLRPEMVKLLADKYKEQPIAMGSSNGVMLEVFASAEGSFTIVASYSTGVACLIASGKEWKELDKPKKGIKT